MEIYSWLYIFPTIFHVITKKGCEKMNFEKFMLLGTILSVSMAILFYGFIAWIIIKVLQFYGVI